VRLVGYLKGDLLMSANPSSLTCRCTYQFRRCNIHM